MGVSHQPGFGLLGSVPRSLSTQPPFATQALKSKFSSKQVVHVKLMYDKETSRMRGKCFLVEMIGSENPNVMGKEIFSMNLAKQSQGGKNHCVLYQDST